MPNKYGKFALKAVELTRNNYINDPKEAWERATIEIFGEGSTSQQKGCPRGAFLGLCEEGMIKGVPLGSYCSSLKNKSYAVKAVNLLKHNPEYQNNKNALWAKAVGEYKAHNNQMDVVIALWENDLIRV
jgi:hypothetical protein